MSSISAGTDKGRYIIRSNAPDQLNAFIDSVRDDSNIELVDTIGPAGRPHTAVFTMASDKAASLEQHFRGSNQLSIEPDRPLSLFGA